MNRRAAHQKAHMLWGTSGSAPGDRYGVVCIRRKSVVDRLEVGYYTRGSRMGSGCFTLMGAGRTWEEAFDRAAVKTKAAL